MDILLKIGSAVLLLVGALYPLMAIYGMMQTLNRPDAPRPSSTNLMLRFFLIASVPLAGILGGYAGFAPSLWESPVIRVIVYGAAIFSVAVFAILLISERSRGPA